MDLGPRNFRSLESWNPKSEARNPKSEVRQRSESLLSFCLKSHQIESNYLWICHKLKAKAASIGAPDSRPPSGPVHLHLHLSLHLRLQLDRDSIKASLATWWVWLQSTVSSPSRSIGILINQTKSQPSSRSRTAFAGPSDVAHTPCWPSIAAGARGHCGGSGKAGDGM